MGNTLYLECNSGISGDMTAAALLDLGADVAVLKSALSSLSLDGYEIKISRVKKSMLDACDFDVILDEENHDHDMKYLHGHDYEAKEHVHEHTHEEAAHGHADHSHGHGHEDHVHDHMPENHHVHDHMPEEHHGHTHSHVHRGPKEIREIICAGTLTDRAKETALRIFDVLAKAEAKAHGVPLSEVHFHEVGAVDSIVDVVTVAVCLDNLDITEVIVSPLTEGQGTVRCQHGILPIPVPAVANIIAEHHLPLQRSPEKGEFVTPTGAAIAAAIRTKEELPASYTIQKIGLGAGKREYHTAGIVRAMLIEDQKQKKDTIVELETNIDDSTGEELGFVMEELFRAGARDVFYQPIFMKKNRPAWLLHVICTEEDRRTLENIIFRETTTIGIRRKEMERTILNRKVMEVHTPYGMASVKLCEGEAGTFLYPEYESVANLSRKAQLSFRETFRMVESMAAKALND